MNEIDPISDLLPLYVSGALDFDQRLAVEKHLPGCPDCQADLALWKSVSAEVTAVDQTVAAPRGMADKALAVALTRTRQPRAGGADWMQRVRHIGLLLRSQMPLVHREIWPASALVIGLGFIAALIAERAGFVYALAPLIAAACVSLIYGPENDPAYELTISTPTSPRQILLARLVLVFGYNLALVIAAMLALLPALPDQQLMLGTLALNWLAPMTFLSAAALALSLWIGATNAISITYVAWLGQFLAGPLLSPQAALQTGVRISPAVAQMIAAYQGFWQTPVLLLALSGLLFAAAVWLAGRQGRGMLNPV